MGCDPFLGEDIRELRTPRPNRNHLTVEVEEATRSDLVVMFLGSPGTLSEITAFAMNADVNPKLVVFNDSRYKDRVSFVNLGPLKLLPPGRLIHYDAIGESPSVELVRHLDVIVASTHFERAKAGTAFSPTLSFRDWITLCLIYVSYPVRYQDLSDLFPWEEPGLRQALRTLFDRDYIALREKKYAPAVALEALPMNSGLIRHLAHTRMALLGDRLRDTDAVADYRLLV